MWSGKCFSCGEWNTLEEQLSEAQTANVSGSVLKAESLQQAAQQDTPRLKVNIGDSDTVFGGGIVPGSIVLIAGEPGIGKSTILLQISNEVAKKQKVLYVSGEESAHQVGLRAKRLKAGASKLSIATSTSADDVATTISGGAHGLVVVDSIQTITCGGLKNSAGSVNQVTSSTHMFMSAAKKSGTALILVGHVTKEGNIAGPKILEHIVDVVLQLEGDRYGGFKVLRSIKNRFGSTNEVAIFEMVDEGLRPVTNPSEALLAERQITDGSVVLATMEGSRPVLVEVQALVNKTAYRHSKRTASGIDTNRTNLLVAMLERRTKLQLSNQDIYVNTIGGIKITEPAADLAICMAIASAAKGMQLKKNAVVFGEVGLSGEIRHVPYIEKRIAEAKKLGFEAAVGPVVRSGTKPALLQSMKDVRTALNTFLEI
jgi:DNA repair protein RadA/Sms